MSGAHGRAVPLTPCPPSELSAVLDEDTCTALQLAQPFARRRSMQDLLAAIIEDFLQGLRARDPGFEKALTAEAEAGIR